MNASQDALAVHRWETYLEDVDREIARLARMCQIRILDPDVIEKVLRKDASVCGTLNPVSFAELHDTITFELAVLPNLVNRIDHVSTEGIEAHVVGRSEKLLAGLPAPRRLGFVTTSA